MALPSTDAHARQDMRVWSRVLLNNSASPAVGGWGGVSPSEPDFIVGSNGILQKEILIAAVFGTQIFGLLGSRTPPPPRSGMHWKGGR